MNLWQGPARVLLAHQRMFRHDYIVVLNDIAGSCGVVLGEEVEVKIVHMKDFAWSDQALRPQWEPDWDRYCPEAVSAMVKAGVLPAGSERHYDSPDTWKKIRSAGKETEAYESGLALYVANMVGPMKNGEMPPVVIADGEIADGYHRINAAMMGGSDFIPYIEVKTCTSLPERRSISTETCWPRSGPAEGHGRCTRTLT